MSMKKEWPNDQKKYIQETEIRKKNHKDETRKNMEEKTNTKTRTCVYIYIYVCVME
jgi:hypothetical protein